MTKKIAILTGEFGQGHLALAKKLKSHLDALGHVDCVDVLNINRLIDEVFIERSVWDRFRYAASHQLLYGYDEFTRLPAWLRSCHLVNVCSRFFSRFYAMIWGTASLVVYRKQERGAIKAKIEQYDCVFSVLSVPNHLLWTSQQEAVMVNVAQDYGQGVTTVWWGRFWDYHLSSDVLNAQVASAYYHPETQVKTVGPVYHVSDYGALSSNAGVDGKTSVLFIPGKTGNQPRFMRKLVSIAKSCLQRGHRVVWRGSEEVMLAALLDIDPADRDRVTVQPYGPLDDLESFDLVVGKGSYNQITESLIKGVPFACVTFLGYWERQNLCIQSEGAQLLDWSRSYVIPSPEQLISMRLEQVHSRDRLFTAPDEMAEVLREVTLIEKRLPAEPSVLRSPLCDFSGCRLEAGVPHKNHTVLLWLKKAVLLPLFASMFFVGGVRRYQQLKKQRFFSCKE